MKRQRALKTQRAGGVAREVEHQPTKCEAVSSNPVPTKKRTSGPGAMAHPCNPSYSEGSRSRLPRPKARPYLQNKQKGLEEWLKWQSFCFVTVKP
jgi:hypothetical protein